MTVGEHREGAASVPGSSLPEAATVLFVDDDASNLKVFEANFASQFRLRTCSSAREALDLITRRPGDFGVLISDQRMPEMQGVELLERSIEVAPDTQRIIITAFGDLRVVLAAVNRGQVSRYFVKPWVREQLAEAIAGALRVFELQTRLRQVELRMLQSERLAAVGQVSAGIAHELMNPVSFVSQNVASLRLALEEVLAWARPLLAAHPDQSVAAALADLPPLLADIEGGARHVREVALGVKAQARGEDVETTCDLADVVDFAVRLTRVEVRQRARIATRGESTRVKGGAVGLTQVLLNLLINAGQAMEGTGRGLIEIAWSTVSVDQVLLSVTDNGSGIPQHAQARIFEPLFTTKGPGEGTGLGLAMSRDIVRSAGGEMTFRSSPGAGTTFEIMLRRA